MKVVLIILMIIAAGVMLWGMSQQKKGLEIGKIFATAGAIVALICAITISVMGSGPSPETALKQHLAYTRVSTEMLGRHLRDTLGKPRVLLVVAPSFGETDKSRNALIEGLEEGLGGKVELLELKPEMPAGMAPPPTGPGGGEMPPMMMPPEMWFTAATLNKALEGKQGSYDVLVSCLGLPADAINLTLWTQQPVPKVAIAQGSIYQLKDAIQGKYVVAAVTNNPKADYESQKSPPANVEKAFAMRYILVTPENIAELSGQYPELFMGSPSP